MQYDTLVFVGRFQPFHKGHKAVINKALELARKVVVLVGSSYEARDIRNPFTYIERYAIIREKFKQSNLFIEPIRDYPYDEGKWVKEVQDTVAKYAPSNSKIGLIGHSKDHTSYYLKLFPKWGNVEVRNVDGIHATDIRNQIFERINYCRNNMLDMGEFSNDQVPIESQYVIDDIVRKWSNKEFNELAKEYQLIETYKKSWKVAPFPPTFVTTDAVVVQSGHILLVKRKASPGKGLWALPGGFIEQHETLEDGVLRELKEETKIKVPVPVLRGSIKGQHVFDAPNRSTRGRTITHAFYIDLGFDLKLPKVTGADDAEKAKWIPFNEVDPELLFEDHMAIIDYFTNVG